MQLKIIIERVSTNLLQAASSASGVGISSPSSLNSSPILGEPGSGSTVGKLSLSGLELKKTFERNSGNE